VPALAEFILYSLIALPEAGTVVEVMGYQVPEAPIMIRSGSVKLMLGVKLTVVAELLYQVTLTVSPARKFLAVPVTPW
jgi:hypothetical protein